jgi:hypothetical protein
MSGHVGDLSDFQTICYHELKDKIDLIGDQQLRQYGKGFADEGIYLRFLRARKWDVDAAYDMLVETLRFRINFQGIGVDAITLRSVINEVKTGKSFFHGHDKEGRPICYIKVRYHDPAKIDPPEGQRFSLFMMEYGRTLLKHPVETVTMLFDMTDTGRKNMDLKTLQFTIQSLQNHYPESLGKVIVYNSSWLVSGIWKIVKPWLDPITAAKVVFLDKPGITELISTDKLLQEYGGTDSYRYDADEYAAEVSRSFRESGPPLA